MNIAFWLMRTARIRGEANALFLGTEPVATYAQFHDRACRVAGWLAERGLRPGDRVALFMKNVPDYLVVQYGAWYAGLAVVPVNAKLHARETAWILDNAGASLCFATPDLAAELRAVDPVCPVVNVAEEDWQGASGLSPVARESSDLAWLFYTSGTTGRPKGVEITHGMLISMSLCYQADVEPVRPEDAALYAAPLSHGAGIYNMMHVHAGARHVFPPSGGFDASEILELAERLGSVHMFAAPTMVKRLTEVARRSDCPGDGFRTIVYAGGPMYEADILDAVDQFGPVFAQIYGQGECPMGITALTKDEVADRASPGWRARLNSVGRAQSAVELRIGDENGTGLPPDTVGEIMVRGDTVMRGYWRNPEATAKTLRDGWLMTGDMGQLDEDGYLTLKDRSKDVIISGGSNIYPREVEEVLLTHPDVSEVAVIGRAHPEWGEEVVAFVVPCDGARMDEAALAAHCLEHIARFKRPKAFFEMAALPKNNYGKVLKTELRDLAAR